MFVEQAVHHWWKWRRLSRNWIGVQKNCVFNVNDISVWIYCVRKRMDLIIIVAHISFHTPVKALYGLTRETYSFKSPHTHWDETHLCCWTEWVCISTMYPMKVAVHKIQSCFTNCVNHSCLVWCQCSSFVALCVDDPVMSLYSACQTRDFYWWCLQGSTISSIVSCTLCMFCYSLECSLLRKIFSLICKLLSLEQSHQETLRWIFMPLLIGIVFNVCVSKTCITAM